ncbi:hypothetical protein CI109_105179 [Kwoniella shandongensis]|uniref:Uncharacterized protein n=1 Tax=Kwoniella shandongensis TaxID=1734106 RepID=A0A5M6C827_9TREE|nr:uncharacterized protein CI109_002020 [Kwoniella shandongensis]KAA5529595.1 hypothetical protein CI109_002020 [Kwoniella shandongensis]
MRFALSALPIVLAYLATVNGQFGPAVSSSSSGSGSISRSSTSRAVASTQAPTTTTPSTTTGSSSGSIPPPPTESVGCVLHVDHYHCEGPAEGVEQTATPTSDGTPTIPSPTQSSNCFWHETHWDCFDSQAEMDEAQAAESGESSGTCIIHVGHTHGDCSASDLACGRILLENYNMPLHIGALFIILVTSGLGAMIPLFTGWARKRPERKDSLSTLNSDGVNDERQAGITSAAGAEGAAFGRGAGLWNNVFFIAKHFGTGVILSTAFIHLLYHGFVMFNNECLGHLSYESTAPAISLAAAFLTFLLDLFGVRLAHKQFGNRSESPDSSPGREKARPLTMEDGHHEHGHDHGYDLVFEKEQNWQVVLLELGIIFHSIMIGVTLGAGSGAGWTTLLIVIVFHQFFEGLALGARVALLNTVSEVKQFGMALAFTLITPLGIAIGIGVRHTFSQNGKASLLSVGILNSISAGILLYAAFKLLSNDFTDGPLRNGSAFTLFVALAAMVAGMIGMSVLGKWA